MPGGRRRGIRFATIGQRRRGCYGRLRGSPRSVDGVGSGVAGRRGDAGADDCSSSSSQRECSPDRDRMAASRELDGPMLFLCLYFAQHDRHRHSR